MQSEVKRYRWCKDTLVEMCCNMFLNESSHDITIQTSRRIIYRSVVVLAAPYFQDNFKDYDVSVTRILWRLELRLTQWKWDWHSKT